MESPPPKKTPYELLRDKRVAEMKKALEPVLQAKAKLREHIQKQREKQREGENQNRSRVGREHLQRSCRRRGLRGRTGTEDSSPASAGGRSPESSKMTSDRDSSSEATESNEEAAIAADVGEDQYDSSDEELKVEESLPIERKKRRIGGQFPKSTVKSATAGASTQPGPLSVEPYGAAWSWVPGHYVPQQPPPPPAPQPWAGGPPTWEQGAWLPRNPDERKSDSTIRRKKRTAYELGSQERATATGKPNYVFVQEGGLIDAACAGKNAWDEAVRNFVPKILDVSIIDWGKHAPHTLKKLREALDNEFEYIGNPLSMAGFRHSVSRYLKSERSRLKTRWLKGKEHAPVCINDDQWDRLVEYWCTPAQKEKAAKMAVARQGVKNLSALGRKGKAGVEADIRGRRQSSPGITELGEAMRSTMVQGSSTVQGEVSGVVEIRMEMAAFKKDVDAKFDHILSTSSAQGAALEEIRSMFSDFMGKSRHGETAGKSLQTPRNEDPVTATVEQVTLSDDTSLDLTHRRSSPDVVEFGPQLVAPNTGSESPSPSGMASLAVVEPSAVFELPTAVPVADASEAEVFPDPPARQPGPDAAGANSSAQMQTQQPESPAGSVSEEGAGPQDATGAKAIVGDSVVLAGTNLPEPLQKKGRRQPKSPTQEKAQKRETRSKTASTTDKKREVPSKKTWKVGDEVSLMNPRSVKQVVATGKISGLPGDQFHFQDIQLGWFRVDVIEILQEGVALMYPNDKADQSLIEHAKGTAALWRDKYLKLVK